MDSRFTFAVALSLAGACRAAPEDKGDTGADSGSVSCVPGTAPEIDGFSIDEGTSTAEGPSLLVELTASDSDGDLHSYQVDLWFDEQVDGSVDEGSDNHITPGPVALDVAACAAPAIASEVNIVLLGEDVLAYDTLYEFAAVVTDAAGLSSAPAITTAQTPSGR